MHLGRFEVAERRPDGSLLPVSGSVETAVAETAERLLAAGESPDALDRLAAASAQTSDRSLRRAAVARVAGLRVPATLRVMADMLDTRTTATTDAGDSGPDRGYDQPMAMKFKIGSDWLAANPPPDSSLIETLAGVAARTLAGEDFRHAAREFLSEFPLRRTDQSRQGAIAERPDPTGDPRHDAYLGALAEHIAVLYGIERPAWSIEPERFLETWWFVPESPGLRAISIAQAPAPFFRRGVFVPERSLHRV